ncbi:hypothetical protein G9A89_019668 [Geosiphon pyriformis]|nr:hypothetical protein G9A89_019668 [Geosiphon pyriformis]
MGCNSSKTLEFGSKEQNIEQKLHDKNTSQFDLPIKSEISDETQDKEAVKGKPKSAPKKFWKEIKKFVDKTNFPSFKTTNKEKNQNRDFIVNHLSKISIQENEKEIEDFSEGPSQDQSKLLSKKAVDKSLTRSLLPSLNEGSSLAGPSQPMQIPQTIDEVGIKEICELESSYGGNLSSNLESEANKNLDKLYYPKKLSSSLNQEKFPVTGKVQKIVAHDGKHEKSKFLEFDIVPNGLKEEQDPGNFGDNQEIKFMENGDQLGQNNDLENSDQISITTNFNNDEQSVNIGNKAQQFEYSSLDSQQLSSKKTREQTLADDTGTVLEKNLPSPQNEIQFPKFKEFLIPKGQGLGELVKKNFLRENFNNVKQEKQVSTKPKGRDNDNVVVEVQKSTKIGVKAHLKKEKNRPDSQIGAHKRIARKESRSIENSPVGSYESEYLGNSAKSSILNNNKSSSRQSIITSNSPEFINDDTHFHHRLTVDSSPQANQQFRFSPEEIALLEKADEKFANDLLNSNLKNGFIKDLDQLNEMVEISDGPWPIPVVDDENDFIQFGLSEFEKSLANETSLIKTPPPSVYRTSRRGSDEGPTLERIRTTKRETLATLREENIENNSFNDRMEQQLTVALEQYVSSEEYFTKQQTPEPEIGKISQNKELPLSESSFNKRRRSELSLVKNSKFRRYSAGNERPLSPNFENYISKDQVGLKRIHSRNQSQTTSIISTGKESRTTRSIPLSKRTSHSEDSWTFDLTHLGTCKKCGRANTGVDWCKSCNSSHFTEEFPKWSSGIESIDNFIREVQLEAESSIKIVEWIPFNQFEEFKLIGKGGYSTVDKATWKGGRIRVWNDQMMTWTRYGDHSVGLKRLHNSQRMDASFLYELKSQWDVVTSDMPTWFGITRDPVTSDFILVMELIECNLRDYVQKRFSEFTWTAKVEMLLDLTWILWTIHESGMVHQDLHCGNILWETGSLKICDLGLSRFVEVKKKHQIYGVLPYIPPEVLGGDQYSKASDIYSFGSIMYEIATGRLPFGDVPHETDLVKKICEGLRPEIPDEVPPIFANLIRTCWGVPTEIRPTARDLIHTFTGWLENGNEEIQKQFEMAEKTRIGNLDRKENGGLNIQHAEAVFVSRLISVQVDPRVISSENSRASKKKSKSAKSKKSQNRSKRIQMQFTSSSVSP